MENIHFSQKVDKALKLLSKERVDEIFSTLAQTMYNIRKDGKLEYNKAYPLELTKAFDQEEPIEFIYAKCAFSVIEQTIGENDSIPKKSTYTQMSIEELEIFKQDEMFDWLDYVNRITRESKEDSLYSENTIFKKEEKESDDKDKKNNSTQSNIKKNIPKGFFKRIGENLNPEDAISQNENIEDDEEDLMFDFYNEKVPELTEEEYLEIFRLFGRISMNNIMEGNLIREFFTNGVTEDALINNLKDLQERFSGCDFWNLSKETLLELGFINFANKMLLVPMWAFPMVVMNGMGRNFGKKDGSVFIIEEYFNDVDFTNSYGCYGNGILIEDLKK